MVYVDDMYAPYKRMKMCHMIADSTEELLAMADRLGLKRQWIQKPGTYREHFDVSKEVRARAVAAGAQEVTVKQLGDMIYNRNPNRKLEA